MTIGVYETHDLLGVVETVKPDVSMYWSQFFPNTIQFDTQFIDFDQISGWPRTLAPFVSPLVQGRVQKDKGFSTMRFEAAYVKPKHVVNPGKLISRRAGEQYMGSLSPAQRYDAIVADYLLQQKTSIMRTKEWMAAQAIINGSVTVSGEDYPTKNISFNRAGGNTVTLTGTALWTDTVNSVPDTNIETWSQTIHSSTGFVVDRITMGGTAWNAFRAHPRIKDLLDTRYLGSQTNVTRDPRFDMNARLVGRLGTVEVWVYADVYDSDTGVATQILPQNKVVLTAKAGIDGVMAHAAIQDKKANFQPVEIFPKMWEEEDPSVTYIMSQSAPLAIPKRADCSFVATVV